MGRKLGVLKPARFREIAEQERRVWDKIGEAWFGVGEYLLENLGLPGHFAASEPWSFTPEMQSALMRAARYFEDSVLGHARDPQAFSQPSNAEIDVKSPTYNGKPILPGELRVAMTTGSDRAQKLIGADASQILGPRLEEARQELLRRAFDRLSDGARVKLGDVLTADGLPGGSIRDLLLGSMENGDNPLVVARKLRKQFASVQDYQWARLSRTEVAFGQNFAMEAEYTAAGFVLPKSAQGVPIAIPPLHPNCTCGLTIDPESGYQLLDVSATACHICQSHLAEQRILTGGIGRTPVDQPVQPVRPEPPQRVKNRLPKRRQPPA